MAQIHLQCGRPGFDPWFGKIPWGRAWQPTPAFWPGEFPWMEEPGELQSMGSQRVRHDWATKHGNSNKCYRQGSWVDANSRLRKYDEKQHIYMISKYHPTGCWLITKGKIATLPMDKLADTISVKWPKLVIVSSGTYWCVPESGDNAMTGYINKSHLWSRGD